MEHVCTGADDVMRFALKTLSTKRISKQQLERLLTQVFSHNTECGRWVEQAIARLRDFDILDDHRLAAQIATRHAAKGNEYIRQRMAEKNLEPAVMDAVLAELEPEFQRAMHAACQQWPEYADLELGLREDKLLKFLQSRGFLLPLCQAVLDQLLIEYLACSDESTQV